MKSLFAKLAVFIVLLMLFIGSVGTIYLQMNNSRINRDEQKINKNIQALCMIASKEHNEKIFTLLNCSIILKPRG